MHPDLLTQAPDVIEFLRAWDMNIERYDAVGKWRQANSGADINDTALWWLNNNVDVWSAWVTEEAAEAVKAALDENKIPAGWPTE